MNRLLARAICWMAPAFLMGMTGICSGEGVTRFSEEDNALLEEISHASFLFFWKEAHPETGLIPDKTTARHLTSIASVGFGLAALPIGVERGWVEREAAEQRALITLQTLRDTNAQHEGMFYHYLETDTGAPSTVGYEVKVSTIDSALMIAGVIVAGEYFGGEVQNLADEIYAGMNWRFYTDPNKNDQVYMAWTPDTPAGHAGHFEQQTWDWYTDETLLISILGIAAPNPEFRLSAPEALLNWKRPVGAYEDKYEYVYSWPGTLFTYIFAQCFLDFRRVGEDPGGVNWWDNTLQAVQANRDWCRSMASQYPTYGENRWGITACSAPDGYAVPGHQPRGAKGNEPRGGVLAPYGAAMAMPWIPEDAVAALRHMRDLKVGDQPLWSDPSEGGYGFMDAFDISENWVSDTVLGIAQGPMLLSIENARSGLVWDLFHRHPAIGEGLQRAGFSKLKEAEK